MVFQEIKDDLNENVMPMTSVHPKVIAKPIIDLINILETVNIVSSQGGIDIDMAGAYIYNGSSAATWELAPVTGNTGKTIRIINEGSNSLTINLTSGNITIPGMEEPTTSITLNPTETCVLYNTSLSWVKLA